MIAKYRSAEHPGMWLLTDFTMEQVEGRIADLEAQRSKDYGRGVDEGTRSQMSAILYTIGGQVEGAPTLSINYLQRLRALVEKEKLAEAWREYALKLKARLESEMGFEDSEPLPPEPRWVP